jgi:hypothetical protein
MSKGSCGSGQSSKTNNQSGCGTKGASQQLASAHVYATPSTEELTSAIKPNDIVLAYVVKTCEPKRALSGATVILEHNGSGPNMAGGRITLCTCKRLMRTSPVFWDKASRSRIWIAGFSSSKGGQKNWLFYLMKVGESFDSQRAIYERLKSNPEVLEKKLATDFVLGDIFVPKTPCRFEFDPDCYKPPHPNHAHRKPPHPDTWNKDINFQGYGGRYPKMLLGDEINSFCYPNGQIFLTADKPMTQGNRRMSGEEFLSRLILESVE